MGDRSNVFFQMEEHDGKWDGIGVYAHWDGERLFNSALAAAKQSLGRVGDPSYFVRRSVHLILDQMADVDAETGHGLWVGGPDDNEHSILVINAMTGKHWFCGESDFRKSAPEDATSL